MNDVSPSPRRPLVLALILVASTLATLVVAVVLVTMFEHKQDARSPYLRVADLDEVSVAPGPWGDNWPRHYEQYLKSSGDRFYGGSSAMPQSKLEASPWLSRLYAGYAFSIDYREARGHAYMLYDQVVTERVHQRPQAGACLHCHASTNVLYRKVGLEALGRPADRATLAASFDMEAVMKGFEVLSRQPYHEVLERLTQMPDGARTSRDRAFPSPPLEGHRAGTPDEGHPDLGGAHPVGCIDCHDPSNMGLRITRPGFMRGIAALAASDAPVPHLASVEAWRRGDRATPYDPNARASRQEMRSFVCGQCHVEYYCADQDTLTFPWGEGLTADDAERFWEARTFPDGGPFYDYLHGETGARLFKAQHPEFELWSQGIHARAGVACADCHMPYERQGAMKLSSHHVRSPMEDVHAACRTCHRVPEEELRARVQTIQGRTMALMDRAAGAMTDMLDAIQQARAAGATEDDLQEVFRLQRKAMWRLDYVSSENSKGFHADQEAARLLGESIDDSRKAQARALRWRSPPPPETSDLPVSPVRGVSEGR